MGLQIPLDPLAFYTLFSYSANNAALLLEVSGTDSTILVIVCNKAAIEMSPKCGYKNREPFQRHTPALNQGLARTEGTCTSVSRGWRSSTKAVQGHTRSGKAECIHPVNIEHPRYLKRRRVYRATKQIQWVHKSWRASTASVEEALLIDDQDTRAVAVNVRSSVSLQMSAPQCQPFRRCRVNRSRGNAGNMRLSLISSTQTIDRNGSSVLGLILDSELQSMISLICLLSSEFRHFGRYGRCVLAKCHCVYIFSKCSANTLPYCPARSFGKVLDKSK